MASASSGMATVAGSHDLAGRLLNNIAGSGTAMGSGSTSTVTRLLSSSEAHTQQQGSSQMMAIPYGDSSTAHYISHQNGAQSDVPTSVFFNFPLTRNTAPGRWAHTATVVGDSVLVYGGVGSSVLDDLWLLDTATMGWRQLSTHAPRSKDRPGKMLGHAAAALANKVWFFGGQAGRKFLHSLYSFDLDSSTWHKHPSDPLPPARAGHAMTTVAGNIVYMFGGQGRKYYNELYKLDPSTGTFVEVEASGKAPSPRRGHSMCWDGRDYLVVFGGINVTSTDSFLGIFSLSRSEWISVQAYGTCPSPRTQHSAVTISPGVVLFFGGCTASGTFHNDFHVLDTRALTWQQPSALNTAPAPRYHHTCSLVHGKLLIYGGINSKQTFEGVVVMETKFPQDLSYVAEELFRMSTEQGHLRAAGSTGPSAQSSMPLPQVPSTMQRLSPGPGPMEAHVAGDSSALSALCGAQCLRPLGGGDGGGGGGGCREGGGNGRTLVLDALKAQLTDLLVKRNMEEARVNATRKAETVESQLLDERAAKDALMRELAQAKLLLAEAEAEKAAAQAAAQEATSRASRITADLAHAQSELNLLQNQLSSKSEELSSSKAAQESLVRELGILASRLGQHQLSRLGQGSAQGLAPGAAGNAQRRSSLSMSNLQGPGGVSSGSRTNSTLPSPSSLRAPDSLIQTRMVVNLSTRASGDSQHADDGTQGIYTTAASDSAYNSAHMDAFLEEDTEPVYVAVGDRLSEGAAVPSGLGQAGSSRSEITAAVPRLLELEAQLSAAHSEQESMQGEMTELRNANTALKLRLSRLTAQQPALDQMLISELGALEQRMENALRVVRESIMQRRIQEQLQAAAAQLAGTGAITDANQCGVCMERCKGVAFNCGHQSCEACSAQLSACPFCRTSISAKIKLFDA